MVLNLFNKKGNKSILANKNLDFRYFQEPKINTLRLVMSGLSKEFKQFVERNGFPYKRGKVILDFNDSETQKFFK